MNPMKILGTITLVALLSLLIAHPVNENAASAQTERTYIALGDSIPAGLLTSLPAARGYPAILHDMIETYYLASDTPANVDLVNLATPGETIGSFANDGQLEMAISEIENTPEGALRTVTLTIGGNDILRSWESTTADRAGELERFEADYAAVIGQLAGALEDHDADVVVTTYYDLTEGDTDVEGSNAWWLHQFNQVIENTASEAGFQVVDLENLFRNRISSLTWFPADIHPTNTGHELIARAIWQQLGYDQVPPEVEISRPDSGETRSRVPTIHATVDEEVGLHSVVLQVDGEDVRELIYVSAHDAWIGVWDARDFAGTEAVLTVTVTDISGNEASDSVTISLPSP